MRFLSLLPPDEIQATRRLNLDEPVSLTVVGEAISITQSWHWVYSVADVNLKTIGGGNIGDIVVLSRDPLSSAKITLKDDAGNLTLAGNLKLDSNNTFIVLLHDGANWQELTRSKN